ncbi:MAG: hypothetical protein WCJ17_02865 [bacterium]
MRTTMLLSLICCALSSSATATLFYVSPQEPIAPHIPIKPFERKTTTFGFGMSRTQGALSYNSIGDQVPLLEQYGTAELSTLYKGLPTRSSGSSSTYFTADGAESLINKDGENTPISAALRFQDPRNEYILQSYHVALTHYLFSGLFIRLQTQFVDQVLTQKPNATGLDANHAYTTSFLAHFDQFLGENNHPSITYNHRRLCIERAGLFAGWAGRADLTRNIFQEIGGSLMFGYTVAPSQFDHPLAPAFLLHGFTHGYSVQAELNAQVASHLAIEVAAATTVHGRFSDRMHIVRDDTNPASYISTPPLIGTGVVRKDPGTLWVLEGTANFNRFKGFYLASGYHFAYQERTKLTLDDTAVLLGANWEGAKLKDLPGQQNKRLNADPRLLRWKNHAVFAKAGFTPSLSHRFVPHIEVCVYWPVLGHRSVCPTRIYTGSGQLSIRWTF